MGALNLVQDPEFGLTEIGPNGTLSEILVDEQNKTDYAIAQLSTAVVGLVAALCCACLSQPVCGTPLLRGDPRGAPTPAA